MISGLIAGSFDIIHPGYVYMFKESKKYCSYLVVALQTDPTLERPEKIKPILTFNERKDILLSIKYIDEVIKYSYEKELNDLLKEKKYSVRILGDDYRGKKVTGEEFSEKIIYIDRQHGWSTTKFKKMIANSLKGEKYDTY